MSLPVSPDVFRRRVGVMANTSLLKLELNDKIAAAAERLQMSRREFLQFCAAMASTLGLPQGADAAVAEAVATKKASVGDLAAFPGMHRLH